MKKPILFFILLLSTTFLFAQGSLIFDPLEPEVSDGIVDFTFDLVGGGELYDLSVEVSFNDGTDWDDIAPSFLTGQLNNVAPANDIALQWNALESFPGQVTDNARLRVTAKHVCGTNFTFSYREAEVTYGTVSKTYISTEPGKDVLTLCWMDRNLGATVDPASTTTNTTEELYGDLFQWGRGDDGHQLRNSGIYDGENDGLATTAAPNTGKDWDGMFITVTSTPNDWLDTPNDDLWQGVDGINNPCPSGWRVPTLSELHAERKSWSSNDRVGAYASALKWPVGGYRHSEDGVLTFVDVFGYVWSSEVTSGTNAYALYFFSSIAGGESRYRANGKSVRCVREP